MVFNQGLVGPKEKPKGVPDGQLVNIPTLGYYSNTLHNVVILADYRISRSWSKPQGKTKKSW